MQFFKYYSSFFVILLFLLVLPDYGLALSDADYLTIKNSSPDFAAAEIRLGDAWGNLPKNTKEQLMKEQREWIKIKRDTAAKALMSNGESMESAYTIVTNSRAKYLEQQLSQVQNDLKKETNSFLEQAQNQAGTQILFLRDNVTSLNGATFEWRVEFPSNTGNSAVDKSLRNVAEIWAMDNRKLGEEFKQDTDNNSSAGWDSITSVMVFRPSANILSVFFQTSSYTGGAHGQYSVRSFNYDLEQGRELVLSDLFPLPERSLKAYWYRVMGNFCSAEHQAIPYFFGQQDCLGIGRGPEPGDFFNSVRDLDGLGHLVLSPQGATVNLDNYEAWSWADGPATLDLTKDEMIAMGASRAIWE